MWIGGVDQLEEEVVVQDENELVLDAGFLVPDANAFGHTFRSSMFYSFFKSQSFLSMLYMCVICGKT